MSSQKFSFSRKTDQIKHSGSGLCLTIRAASRAPKATVYAGSCTTSVGTIPEETRFTYDAERGIIQSALNTVLDVKSGTIESGTPVWTGTRTYAAGQQWASPIPTNGLFDWL